MTIRANELGEPTAAVHRGYHEWNGRHSLTNSVAELLAELAGEDPTEIPPLYESVDMDAVEAVLLDPDGTPREKASISFAHVGYEVTLHGSGEIVARSADPIAEP